MREFWDWVDATPIGATDLMLACIVLIVVSLVTYMVRLERSDRQRRDARLTQLITQNTYAASRRERGAWNPLTQYIGIALIAGWRDLHPEEICAELHLDPAVYEAMDDLLPVSDLPM